MTVALLEWSLHVDCPKCSESNDLARANHDTEKAMRTAVRWAERCHGIGASGEASK